MLYEVLIYEGKVELEGLNRESIEVIKSGVLILIDGRNNTSSLVEIEEKIKLFDFLKRKNLTENDIYDLAEYTVNKLIPNASEQEKENAKNNYLEDVKKLKLKGFVFRLEKDSEKADHTIIISGKNHVAKVLDYLGIKQNMTVNIFPKLGIHVEDFLLWICWVTNTSRTFPGITVRNISEDRTIDRSYTSRSQKEGGGRQILDSLDFKYRVGTGYPLNGLKFFIDETNVNAHLEIGIFSEDTNYPMMTVSNFRANTNGTLYQLINATSNANHEIIKINLAIDIIHRLVNEYKNDKQNWSVSKQSFIDSQLQDASQLLNKQKSGSQNP